MREIIDEANSITTQSIARDAHICWESHNLPFIYREVVFEAFGFFSIFIIFCEYVVFTNWHAIEVFVGAVKQEDFCMTKAD